MMLGHLMEWFYSGLGGIRQEENSIGFKEIIIKPEVVDGIAFVKTSYNSPYGKIVCEWEKSQDKLMLHVSIPVNTSAKVFMPTFSNDKITESGKDISFTDEIKYLGADGERRIYRVGSGNYWFEMAN